MTKKKTAILWVRKDLRLNDNLALLESLKYEKLIPIYIWNESDSNPWKEGDANKWWLHQTLHRFKESLLNLGSDLIILKGKPDVEMSKIVKETKANIIICNEGYSPDQTKTMFKIKRCLEDLCVSIKICSGNILCERSELLKKDGSPYLVYTAFWRNFVKKYNPKKTLKPNNLPQLPKDVKKIQLFY